ncbi:MAG: NERD domain-containing protein [Firmicutes bacterium]|nr:NERD domain-containing protein [Bacillota bacterium]
MSKFRLSGRTIKGTLSRLEKEHYNTYHDVELQKTSTKVMQIDHLIVSTYGIFILKICDKKGLIEGTEHGDYWTNNLAKKRKFPNPLKQCKQQARFLREILHVPITHIVVFSPLAQLKIDVNSHVVYVAQLVKTIHDYDKEIFTDVKLQEVRAAIENYRIKSEEKKTRIYNVKEILEERKRLVAANICPKCGSALVVREGKRRAFKGCSRYPKCNFKHGI